MSKAVKWSGGVFILLIAASGMLFFYRHALLLTLGEYHLKNYFHERLGAELSIPHAYIQENSIIIERPIWRHASTGDEIFAAERMEIKYDLALLERKINFDARIAFINAECSSMCVFFHQLWPDWDQWVASSGSVDGCLNIHQNGCESDLHFHHLILKNSQLALQSHIPEAHVQISSSGAHGQLQLLQPASLTFQGGAQWSILEAERLVGNCSWRPGQKTKLDLHGVCRHQDQTHPLHLTDEPNSLSPQIMQFNLEYGPLAGQFILDCTSDSKTLSMHLKGKGRDFIAFAPIPLHQSLSTHFAEEQLTIDAILKQNAAAAKLSGTLTVFEPEHLNTFFFDVHFDRRKSLQLRSGYFHANDLPLNKYVAPFVLNCLEGDCDVRGAFDAASLILYYDARNVRLENSHFSLEFPSVKRSEGDLPAAHYFDFATGTHGGVAPIHQGVYFEKHSELSFTDISAQVILGQSHAIFSDAEAYCQEIHLAGDIDVDYSCNAQERIDVDIHASAINGQVSQLKSLCAQFSPSSLLIKLPMEGNISLRPDGSRLHFSMQQQEIAAQACVRGSFTEGSLIGEGSSMSVRDLSLEFDYDYPANTLKFSDIQGALLVGSPKHLEEYILAGEYLSFMDHGSSRAKFDLWVGDKNRDIIRVVGDAKELENPGRIEISLNNSLSHFGDVHPNAFQLIIQDWAQIETAHLQFNFRLKTLLNDLQRFSRTGLLFLSRHLLKHLNSLNSAEGDFKVNLQYDRNASLFTYHVLGENLAIGSYAFKKCLLNGQGKDNAWTIDQLQLDDFSLAADLTNSERTLKVNFLGLRCGQSLLAGLSGEYLKEENAFDAKVKLLEIDLSCLHEWPKLHAFAAQFIPKGQLRANDGRLRLEWDKNKSRWRMDASLNASLRNWQVQNTQFQDINNFTIHVDTDRGLTCENIKYFLNDAEYEVKNFSLHCDSLALHLAAAVRYRDNLLHLGARVNSPSFASGEFTISEQPYAAGQPALVVHWRGNPLEKFSIHQIEGSCAGVSAQIARESGDSVKPLIGEVVCTPHAKLFLPSEIQTILERWRINGTYRLTGEWSFWPDPAGFTGSLEAQNCEAQGYQFDTLAVEATYSPNEAHLKNLRLSDPAGRFFTEHVLISKQNQNSWLVHMPLLKVDEFKPSGLRQVDPSRTSSKTPSESAFIIRHLELNDLKGNLSDPSSFVGDGFANFANPPKRDKPNPIWEVPSEILSDAGLTLIALCPVAGDVHYRIENGKIVLKKFKDVYSAGRLSKFYLAKDSGAPSYIDFDGNLHIQIRMKQYSLLLKLAEFFTLSIEGTAQHPTYTLLKQRRSHSHQDHDNEE